ncbi:MAG: 3'-5' exonuclease [Bacteroidales bacterium]|jgi:DNA polymerase-3 subunit epsilon|nr:3'-5' exonuclease [Bacteroidales bacterium]MCI1785936.1 3'-5' exonuclease [Bacteroidales bacterium]
MELKLERPLLFFDIESTGLNIPNDSIIELSFVKILPDNEQRIKTWRVRPWDYKTNTQRPISPGAKAVNGIKDEELTDCPKFYDIADEVAEWLKDSDLAGYNSSKFDLPMLAEEIERIRKYKDKDLDINLHDKKMVDVQTIYFTMEPRNLKAAYRFYCGGEDFENAHSAEADTIATFEVLKGQLDRYPETLKNDVSFLSTFAGRPKTADYAGRLVLNDKKEPVISFGKHRGKTAREVYFSEPSYFAWIENGEFTLDTKRQFALLKKEYESEKRKEKAVRDEISSKPLEGDDFEKAGKNLMEKFNNGKTGRLF